MVLQWDQNPELRKSCLQLLRHFNSKTLYIFLNFNCSCWFLDHVFIPRALLCSLFVHALGAAVIESILLLKASQS